ncbi:Adenosine deaminase [Streptomyces tendae]
MERVRDLSALPKAHLHLHFTGSMRPTTLLELADKHGVRLPETLTDALGRGESPKLRATDERGWFRFQRLYDAARSCLQEPEDIQRLVREAAEEDLRDGSQWLEIQVDPTSYAPRLGGLIPALEIILDAVETTVRDTGIGMRVLVAANRMKHPLDARTLARLAVRYAERGVVGFGLSNDERRGMARDFDRAFAIARDGGPALRVAATASVHTSPAATFQGGAVEGDALGGDDEGGAVEALVADDQVGAAADDQQRGAGGVGLPDGGDHLVVGGRGDQPGGGAAPAGRWSAGRGERRGVPARAQDYETAASAPPAPRSPAAAAARLRPGGRPPARRRGPSGRRWSR